MFYCICLPHIIFHRGNSVAIQPHCTSQQLNHHHSTNHATHSKVNHVQDFYMFYKAIIIALCGLRGAPALPCGRRWNAVPTGSILLFVAEYRNADHSDSCLFVSRAGGHSCPAKRCDPQGWRWRVRTARRSRGWVRTRQRQVAVRRLIDSPVFVVAPKAPLIRVFNCAVLDAARCSALASLGLPTSPWVAGTH